MNNHKLARFSSNLTSIVCFVICLLLCSRVWAQESLTTLRASSERVPVLQRPFSGKYGMSNWFDHNLPFQFSDTNGFILTSHGEKSGGIDGHSGYDWAMPEGTPIYAVASGEIFYAGTENPFYCPLLDSTVSGQYIELQFEVNGERFYADYVHLSQILVTSGQSVSAGDLIGYSGNTGCSSGPHLHFAVYRSNTNSQSSALIDPFGWFGKEEDPWAADSRGAASLYLWKEGEAPQRFLEAEDDPNPCDACEAPVAITKVRWMGVNDKRNPNNEYLELTLDTRFGGERYNLAGMTIYNNAGQRFKFPAGAKIRAGTKVRVYSGSGTNRANKFYWGKSRGMWNNFPGDCVQLFYRGGKVLMYSFILNNVSCRFVSAAHAPRVSGKRILGLVSPGL